MGAKVGKMAKPVVGIIRGAAVPKLLGELEGDGVEVDDVGAVLGLELARPGVLLGSWTNSERGWEPKKVGAWAAVVVLEHPDDVVTEGLVFVVESSYRMRVACCPPPLDAYGNLEKSGTVLALCLPPELMGDEK